MDRGLPSTETMGHREELNLQALPPPPSSSPPTLTLVVILGKNSLLDQTLSLHPLGQLRGRQRELFLSLLGLECL